MSFPLSPTNGQTAVLNGITYSYSSASTLWTRVTGAVPNTIKSTSSPNSPTNPNIGDIWYNTVTDAIYRYTSDGTISYWLDVTGASITLTTGTVSYASSTVAAASTGTTSTFVISNTTTSASTNTGALRVAGGVGIGGAVYIGQPSYIAGAQISTILTYRLASSLGGANANTAQSVFGVGVTLVGSTIYQFQLVFGISRTAGTTTHTIGFGFGGTASLNNINYVFTTNETTGAFPTIAVQQSASMVLTAANTAISATTSVASKSYSIVIFGTISVNSGGTFIPQYTPSAAPGGAYTTAAGSYMTLTPINSITGTWA